MKKRLLTTLFAASLVLGSVAPAGHLVSASESQATITVNSTQKGATYKAYKLFDATITGPDADKKGVSYTLPKGKEAMYKNEAFSTLFDTFENGDLTYVVKKEETTDQQIADWAKTFVEATKAEATTEATENNGDGVETLNVPYGYYFVGTTVGGGATIMVTSAAPNATIQEKNNEPTWGENGGKTIDSQTKTYSVGDTITYTLDYNNATYYAKGEKVYQYVIKDNLGEGIKFNKDSIKVTVDDEVLEETELDGVERTYKVTKTETGFEITIPWAKTKTASTESGYGNKDDFFYKPISKIKVTYTGVLKSAAAEGSTADAKNKNKATINPNTKNTDPGKEVHVYDGEITVKKVDGQTPTKTLEGAKFVLKRNGKFMKFDKTADKWSEVETQAEATVETTNNQGIATFSGLAAGEYQLIETEAPKGYNLKKEPTTVTLTFDENTADGDTLLATPQIENNQGAELPSTGGFGTTVFYTLGASLIVGAGVVMVARRRLRD
ncbi:SpaH/EbpB family LPXTG-anchored major pilin [Streptococcus entericus]|uniref:SpaH/EbpB family LPXTG-anchored major pilin n=1 Tax=Streptococcus entericus TaxID=155680 RepID=UPI00036703AA|nr:SpaH/EbpB family LPXTG-anchored major pilin [Streptococcus entericus]